MKHFTTAALRSRLASDVGEKPTPMRETGASMAHQRLNLGLLAEPERRILRWLAERTPHQIKPDHLTAAGVAGAMLVMVGFVLTNFSALFVILAILGLFLNWLGDSLDGTLARYRRVERPKIGYFIDHSCDLVSQTFIFMGLGLSPYFTITSALFALSMYLLISSYTYIKVMILRTHHLSYGGMGATELRVMIACWSLFAIWFGPAITDSAIMRIPALNAVIGSLWALVFIGFIAMVRSDLSKFRDVFGENERGADLTGQPDGTGAVRKSLPGRVQPLPPLDRSILIRSGA